VKSGDKSAGKGNFAAGDALLQNYADAGKSILGSKYPDSGTTGRAAAAALAAALVGGHEIGVPPSALIPGAVGAGMASLPYTNIGGKLAATILAKRPAAAVPLAGMVRSATPALIAGGAMANQ